jgi:lipopolysaccharide heptosyltransferase II
MSDPKHILVVQLKRAGDVIVTTPILPALRKALPEAKIDFLVDPASAPILENNPYIREVRVYDRNAIGATWRMLRKAAYDWIIDFQSSPRSILAGLASGAGVRAGYRVTFWGHFLNHAIRRPGNRVSVTEGKMELVRSLVSNLGAAGERKIYLTDEERTWAKNQISKGQGEKAVIGLIPTHRRPSRRWPAQSFVALARLLVIQGRSVLFFWGPGEEDYVSAIQKQVPQSRMIPPTSLRQMAALLEQCETVITNDNGPMHVAEAVGAKTVTLYGPTDPVAWNAGGANHHVLQAKDVTCLGCNLNACPFEHECMTHISPEQVLAELR